MICVIEMNELVPLHVCQNVAPPCSYRSSQRTQIEADGCKILLSASTGKFPFIQWFTDSQQRTRFLRSALSPLDGTSLFTPEIVAGNMARNTCFILLDLGLFAFVGFGLYSHSQVWLVEEVCRTSVTTESSRKVTARDALKQLIR